MESLFERFLPRVRRIVAIRLGRSRDDLLEFDDIAQEVMVDAFRGLGTIDLESDPKLTGWLTKIVENRIRMTLREGRAVKRGGGNVKRFGDAAETFRVSALPGADATPSQNAVGAEAQAHMDARLQQLSERQREAVIHRFHCGMSYEEMAEEMGLAGAAAARSLYSKALRALGDGIAPG